MSCITPFASIASIALIAASLLSTPAYADSVEDDAGDCWESVPCETVEEPEEPVAETADPDCCDLAEDAYEEATDASEGVRRLKRHVTTEVERLDGRVDDLEREHDLLVLIVDNECDADSGDECLPGLKQQITELRLEISTLRAIVGTLREDVDGLSLRMDGAEGILRDHEVRITRLELVTSDLEDDVDDLQETLEELIPGLDAKCYVTGVYLAMHLGSDIPLNGGRIMPLQGSAGAVIGLCWEDDTTGTAAMGTVGLNTARGFEADVHVDRYKIVSDRVALGGGGGFSSKGYDMLGKGPAIAQSYGPQVEGYVRLTLAENEEKGRATDLVIIPSAGATLDVTAGNSAISAGVGIKIILQRRKRL